MAGTDNSLLAHKVKIRLLHTSDDTRILECFSGHGMTWHFVKRIGGFKALKIDKIDIRDIPGVLKGDNRKWLTSIDLSHYDCIDLDAYGIPFDQLEILTKRGYTGGVFVTFIQSSMGALPLKLLLTDGVTNEMRRKSPTIFNRFGWDIFKNYLAKNGVTEIHHFSEHRKHYCYFRL